MSMISIVIQKNHKLQYFLKKHLFYYIRGGYSYWVKSKESIYIYKSRTLMEHKKNHTIISKTGDLNTFTDKFKWSKHQDAKDIHITCTTPHRSIDVMRDENWHCYTVIFDEIAKGKDKDINIVIDKLEDTKMEALPFLSANVTCRTESLRLLVKFEDRSLDPSNIRYQIYDNYASNNPFYEESLTKNSKKIKFDVEGKTIEVEEHKPIFGYRYVIKWDFR